MAQARILVVDDEAHIRNVLTIMLEDEGYEVLEASNGLEAVALADDHIFDVVLCDIRMPEMDGVEVLRRIKQVHEDTTVIMMTAYSSVETALDTMKAGAFDYVAKPFNEKEIMILVEKALDQKRLIEDNRLFRREIASRYDFSSIIGVSRALRQVFEKIKRVVDTRSTILITGESGTGKELFAKAIHYNSPRKGKPLVAVNCGAVPHNLLESEFFGHAKGAFSGAVQEKRGLFEEADGSTLFLDEIGELPVDLQVKVLRAIQEQEVRRVGENLSRKVDIRILAATNRNLEEAVKEGSFREDLYYRLNVVSIHIPPLRERTEDIAILARHFVEKYEKEHGRERKALTPETVRALSIQPLPGNVRELENRMEQAVLMTDGDVIRPEHLELGQPLTEGGLQLVIPEERLDLKAIVEELSATAESILIRRALEKSGGNRTHAAKLLGIGRRTLLYKMSELGLGE